MPKWMVLSLVLSAFFLEAHADDTPCENQLVSVKGQNPKVVESICDAVEDAEALFLRCNLPALQRLIEIRIVDELAPGCVAQFHCDEDRIEILAPKAMDTQRNRDGVLGFLPIEIYFHSIVVHELAHAVYDDEQCPFQSCIVANEFIAYAMQFMSLKPADQSTIQNNAELSRHVSRNALNATSLFLAPDLFVKNVWAHLSTRKDICTYVGQISNGTVFLDRDRH
ncbi:MAG: DUF6639 family protein [Hyphomicrobiales bacterium]